MRRYLLYAFGEIALVMLGILLALQVNNWNELRKQKLEEDQILQCLHESLLGAKRQSEKFILDESVGLRNIQMVRNLLAIKLDFALNTLDQRQLLDREIELLIELIGRKINATAKK